MKSTNVFSLAGRKKRHTANLKNKNAPPYPLPASASAFGILFPHSPLASMQASVIVPAKNESTHILQTLEALRNQYDTSGQSLSHNVYEVLLLTNNCSDDTYCLAKKYQEQHPSFHLHIADIELAKSDAHIGTVRRLLMDEAFRRHIENGNDGVILSTDGDTEVDRKWIANTLNEMNAGYDALGGRILTRNTEAEGGNYYHLDSTYRCLAARLEALISGDRSNVKTSHFQCFGASLAVRCSAYEKAGRLPVIPFLEDEAFSRALYRIDARVKKSADVKVYTSARLHGRVKAGLSVHLLHLEKLQKGNVILYAESLATLLAKYDIKQLLRNSWQKQKTACSYNAVVLQTELKSDLPRTFLIRAMQSSLYFGEYWEKIETAMYRGKWKRKQKPVAISEAISELRNYLQDESVISA